MRFPVRTIIPFLHGTSIIEQSARQADAGQSMSGG
jgi:hypothetical protein